MKNKKKLRMWENRMVRYAIFLYEYLILEKPRGLDFTMRDTRLFRYSKGKYHGYSKTDEKHLNTIFWTLDYSRSRKLLDVGCGKGVILKEAAGFPFEKISGIEIQPELVKTAEKNLKLLKLQDRAFCMRADAETFDGYGDYNVFFFFNPFSEEVFQKVIARILQENRDKTEELIFIYHNPQFIDALEKGIREEWAAGKHSSQISRSVLHDSRKDYDTVILRLRRE